LDQADLLLADKIEGDFVLIETETIYTERIVKDSCGRTVTITDASERVVGINISVSKAAQNTVSGETDSVNIRLWWIGSSSNQANQIDRLSRFGLTEAQMTQALREMNSDTMSVYVIPELDLPVKLAASGLTSSDITTMTSRTMLEFNLSPESSDVFKAVEKAFQSGGGANNNGDNNFEDPQLLVANTIDFGRSFPVESVVVEPNSVDDYIVDAVTITITAAKKSIDLTQSALLPALLNLNINLGTADLSYSNYVDELLGENVGTSSELDPTVGAPSAINNSDSLAKSLASKLDAMMSPISNAIDSLKNITCISSNMLKSLADFDMSSSENRENLSKLMIAANQINTLSSKMTSGMKQVMLDFASIVRGILYNIQALKDSRGTCKTASVANFRNLLGY